MAAMGAAKPLHASFPPHDQHHHQQTNSYAPQPGSPTLTNPDMILPEDYERTRTPDLDLHGRESSPLLMWKHANGAASAADLQTILSLNTQGFVPASLAGSNAIPTTPIIYGNGTMLSDIGEVTEVESTVGRPSPGRALRASRLSDSTARGVDSGGEAIGGFANGMGRGLGNDSDEEQQLSTMDAVEAMIQKKKMQLQMQRDQRDQREARQQHQQHQQQQREREQRQRSDSIDSTSTITTQEQRALFADFDDTISVGDSVFQGDDEESMASSYVEGIAAREREPQYQQPVRQADLQQTPQAHLVIPSPTTAENNDRLSTYSTTSLSRRAEEILASAKKRLTHMEGNLTRARSSLHIVSPHQMVMTDGSSTPSPPHQKTLHRIREGAASAMSSPGFAPGHVRNASSGSETAAWNGKPYRALTQRSQSALGAAGGYRKPLASSKSADHILREASPDQDGEECRIRTTLTWKITSVQETGLEPLDEDDVAIQGGFQVPLDGAYGNGREAQQIDRLGSQLESFLTPTSGSFGGNDVDGDMASYNSYRRLSNGSIASVRSLQRSASAAQMRDIKDQVKDLKGKISSLREQARADTMKRRSMQSLRTPSPFTHARVDQWYAEPVRPAQMSDALAESDPDRASPLDGGLDGAPRIIIPGRHTLNGQKLDEEQDQEEDDDDDEGTEKRRSSDDGKDSSPQGADDDGSIYSEALVEIGTPLQPATSHSPERRPLVLAVSADVVQASESVAEISGDGADESAGDGVSPDPKEENVGHKWGKKVEDAGLAPEEQPEDSESDGFLDVVDLGEGYESEDSDGAFHDTVEHPISHEDRADAFDYEHFFLHSAMGSMSRQKHRQRRNGHGHNGRRNSVGSTSTFTSEGSVETTRGPATSLVPSGEETSDQDAATSKRNSASSVDTSIRGEDEEDEDDDDDVTAALQSRNRSRRNSNASVSTVETFATADEGQARKSAKSNRDTTKSAQDRYFTPEPDRGLEHGPSTATLDESRPESAARTLLSSKRSTLGSASPTKTSAQIKYYHLRSQSSTSNGRGGLANGGLAGTEGGDVSISSIPEEASERSESEAGQSPRQPNRAPVSGPSSAWQSAAMSDQRSPQLQQPTSPSQPRGPFGSLASQQYNPAPMNHRPSVSSIGSTGTTRSFPLVNKHGKGQRNSISGISSGFSLSRTDSVINGISESIGAALGPSLENLADTLLKGANGRPSTQAGTASGSGSRPGTSLSMGADSFMNGNAGGGGNQAALLALQREDRLLVERLVASLGQCVLGLTENGRAGPESRMYRRRIDAARLALEGLGPGLDAPSRGSSRQGPPPTQRA